ncbi:hypothetical protein [Candidatus Parabeggiatoa sp. HSG14]|uniref:CAF17-like 4Fe-4S cluster assembly/insertion protein YgfZ n=1 Tax=Candidatus Parabeggiatoa sp. HSG14 TaxID=3055593 RepID=UPI0025A6BED3|nr:hypothetical protein [Thiotrichales bacterium HSG14]
MIEEWTENLKEIGAQFDTNTVIHFGKPKEELQQALHGDIITDLSHFGLIKVSGGDAEKFLQGQLTNDVRKVTAQRNQLNACCTPKGRILINFRLFKRDSAYYFLLPQESVTTTLKHLQKYIMRADVKLEDFSNHLLRFGISGTHSTRVLKNCLGFTPPTEMEASLTTEQTTILRIQGIQPRYIILTETPQDLWQCSSKTLYPAGSTAWQCTNKTLHPVGSTAWQLLEILAGLPQILSTTVEAFVPQMVNYHAIGGVSFKKGCYTGQEIVARMQYLGSLKRRMYLAKMNTESVPKPGDTLYTSTEEQSVGKIVNAVPHPDGGMIALAVISIKNAEADEIHWLNQEGASLEFMELPYSLS